MVARKSPRVKKSTVVYQSPEQVPRASKNVTTKPIPPKRSYNRDIELQMECVDDELSPAQLKAIKEAQKEHEKANDLIKEVRAGNILVPSSQPNTFTIVPPKPPPPPPPQPPTPQVQTVAVKVPPPQQDVGSQRGLPPPRPAQFLSKQLQEMNKTPGSRSSPDVILISDTPAMSASSKTTAAMPVSQMPGNQLQLQQVTSLLASQGPGATPQQVYKFVSLPSNMPANIVQNQWALRPLLTVPPQQQSQMTFLTHAPTPGVAQFVGSVPLQQGQMPAARSTGEELDKIGGAKLTDWRGVRQGSTVIQETYLKKYGASRIRSRYCLLFSKRHQGHKIRLKNIEKKCCVSSKAYSLKVWLHCVRISKLFGMDKAKQAYSKSQVKLGVWTSPYNCCFKSNRRKVKRKVDKSKKYTGDTRHSDNNVLNLNSDDTNGINNLNCDKVEQSNKEPSRTVDVFSDFDKENKNPNEVKNAHFACDRSVYTDSQNSHGSSDLKNDMCQLLNEKTGYFNEPDLNHAKQSKSADNVLRTVFSKGEERKEFDGGLSNKDHSTREIVVENNCLSNMSYCGRRKCGFQLAFVAFLGQQHVSTENRKDVNHECNTRTEEDMECTHNSEVDQKPVRESNEGAFQDSCLDLLEVCKADLDCDSNVQKVRNPLGELNHINKTCGAVAPKSKIKIKTVPCFKDNRISLINLGSTRDHCKSAKITGKDKENMKCFTKLKCKDFKRHKATGKKKHNSLNRLYETLMEDYIPRNSLIVNMVYESARHLSCDSDNSSMRAADECSSVAEGQLSDITNLSSGSAKEAEVEKVTNINPDLNEISENNTADLQVQGCVKQIVEYVVTKEKKQTCHVSLEKSELNDVVDTVESKETREGVQVVETKRSQMENGNNLNEMSSSDSSADVDSEKYKIELCERKDVKAKMGDTVLIESVDTDGQCNDNFERDDCWSDCSGETFSEDEIELVKQESEISVKPKSKKEKWYEEMSMLDAMYVVILCSQIGFTKISRDLQIPKTELLKLRRFVKKSKYYQSKVFDATSKTVGTVQKVDKLSEQLKCNLVKSTTCQKDLKSSEVSVLKSYHPYLYQTAQNLLRNVNKNAESCQEGEWKQGCSEKDETKDIASEELEPCQRLSSIHLLGNIDAGCMFSSSVYSDSSRAPSTSVEADSLTQVPISGSLIRASENSVIPNTRRLDTSQDVLTMANISDYDIHAGDVGSEKQECISDPNLVSKLEGKLETVQTDKFKEITKKTIDQEQAVNIRERIDNSDSENDLVIDFDNCDTEHPDDCMLDNYKRTDKQDKTKLSGTQSGKNAKDGKKHILSEKERDLTELREDRGQSEQNGCFDEDSCNEKKLENCKNGELERPVNELPIRNTNEQTMNKGNVLQSHDSYGLQNEDLDRNLIRINDDHCYEIIPTADAGKECKDTPDTIKDTFVEYEEECLLEKHGALHIPLNDCLTYPEKTWEEIEGRKVDVFKPVSKERLDKIIKHVSTLGLKSAALCYNIPEEHIQLFIYHTLSCSEQNKINHCKRLDLGIPANYVSSNSANEVPSKVFSEVISLDEKSVNNDRSPAPVLTETARQDILNKLRVNIKGKPDTELKTGHDTEMTFNLTSPLDLDKGKKIIIFMGSSGSPQKSMKALDRRVSVISEEQKQDGQGSGKCSKQNNKKVQKKQEVSKRTEKEGAGNEHNVYTRDFLKYFAENDLYGGFKRARDVEITEEHLEEIRQIDMENHVKTYTCINGKERHRYSPELQRKLLLLGSEVGLKAVSNYFDIKFDTLNLWRQNLRKALEKYNKGYVDLFKKSDGTKKDQAGKHSTALKRVLLSRELRIKIAHLCTVVGVQEVYEQYNLNRKTLRKWIHDFKDERLPNYELTSKELVELVDYDIYRSAIAKGGKVRSASSLSISSIQSQEEVNLSLRIESVIGSDKKGSVSGTENTTNEEFDGEKEMENEQTVREGKSSKESLSEKELSKSKTDQSLQMTFPNNMEVILDIDENEDESDAESIIQDLERECDSPFEDSPVISDSEHDSDFEEDESMGNEMISKNYSTEVANVNEQNCKEESLKKDFIDQNSSFMEAVNKELVLSDSENEDVVEIVSWNVNSENTKISDRANKDKSTEKLDQCEHNAETDLETVILHQICEVNDDKLNDETEFMQYGDKANREIVTTGNENDLKSDAFSPIDKDDMNVVDHQDEDVASDKEDSSTGISVSESEKRDVSAVSEEKCLPKIPSNSSTGKQIDLTYVEKSKAALMTEASTGEQNSTLNETIICSDERDEQAQDTAIIPEEDNLSVKTFEHNLSQNENKSIDGHNSLSECVDNSQTMHVVMADVISTSDVKKSNLKEPQLQMVNPIEIKDEPYDEEFDRIEKGINFKRENSDQSKKDQKVEAERLGSGKVGTNDLVIGKESNASTNDNGIKKTGTKDYEINQLGTGDVNNSQTQGSTFQSSSGNNSSGSQGTAPANMSGNVSNIDLNINSLSAGSANVQIVGTQDLIPGQEYIIVDPRLFSSGSSTFQNIRPPSLLRPPLRSPGNTVNSVRPRLHVRGLVSSAPNSVDPRPVHIVENRSAKIGTSRSPIPGTEPGPRLTMLGNQNVSNQSQGIKVSPGNQSVRSLLTGMQSTTNSSLSRTVVVNTSPAIHVPDQRNLSPGRSSLATPPGSNVIILQTKKSPSDHPVTKSNDAVSQNYKELSKSVIKSVECVQTSAHTEEIGKDKSLSYTLKGVGSISSENLSIPSTSVENKPSTSRENINIQHESVHEEVRPQFSKYLSNSELLLEKERRLLQTLLLQKSGQNKASTAECATKSLLYPGNKQGQIQSSNRIDSLIQKMTNRVRKGPDDYKIDWTLSAMGTDKSEEIETEKVAKPCSASEILFGEHSSPKKNEKHFVERESIKKFNSVKSALFSGTKRTASPGNSSGVAKKDLRKSPLVTREIDSTEDESSTNSSTSESSASSNSANLSVGTNEHTDGRVEHVDLSAKLKSLLTADIFNVIESEKHDGEEDDDLIEMLAKPSDSVEKSNTGSSSTVRKNTAGINHNDTEAKSSSPSKKGNYINYSLNIKKKLGKLASMFSIVSLNKKYGIGTQTLSKWKAKYQDEEIAGLELTEEELQELEEVNKVKKTLYGSSEPEYDIYVDNPEEDELDNETKKSAPHAENIHKSKVEKINVPQAETKQAEIGVGKIISSDKPSFTSESNKPNLSKVEKATKSNVKPGTPLYITIDDDASDEMKQQLRRNLKTQKTAEQTWSNGAFLETSKSSLASVFGTDGNESEKKENKSPSVDKSQSFSANASDTESASEKENDELARGREQRQKTIGKLLEEKTAASDNGTWEKTVYLCPDEGVFKYRYELKTNQESTENDKSNENPSLSVLDSLFKSPASLDSASDTASQGTVNEQSDREFNTSSSPATIAKMLKETKNPASSTHFTTNIVKASTDSHRNKPLSEELNQNTTDDQLYSGNFKWTVVKEARKSGFEKTAKWYNISMTDIMKWHDNFLHEKKVKEMNAPLIQPPSATETSSVLVDLTVDEGVRHKRTESNSTPTPGKGRLGSLNANLSFERIQVKEGAITKPRFNTKSNAQPVISPVPSAAINPSNRPQRTRMGPNTIKYATPRVDPGQLQKFQADVQGDLGIMPKLMKQSNSKDGVEIASTWKQVQSVLKPVKPTDKRYSLEFKQKVITECEQKGQKTVSLEHRIPYNEISRWRLEAKKSSTAVPPQSSAFTKTDLPKRTDSSKTISAASLMKAVSEPGTSQLGVNETRQGNDQESLKIKIKLSSLPQTTSSSKKKILEQTAEPEVSSNKGVCKQTGPQKALTTQSSKKSSPLNNPPLTSRGNRNESERNDKKQASGSERSDKKQSAATERTKTVERSAPTSIDEDADLRMELINFCFDQGVLKTQKKYNVTRQSIIDLMKEYDELNKYEVDNYNKSHGFHSFKTKLVSREKTSVEVTNAATQPVIVKNLNDYIVTQEYMKTVVDYALKHGITAASRKYKRKTSTVRSWMNQFQREVKKKISVEQLAKEQELIANNMSIEDARKISNLEARKKKQLLEAEFKRHIVEFARQFGITAASRRFKKKAATVKSWMGHFMKCERDAKRQEEAETRKNQLVEHVSSKSPRQSTVSGSPRSLSLPLDTCSQKSPSSHKLRTPPHSPIWEQDFVIKPSSSKSPLKLTFSPRRKSSPVIVIGSSTEEDTFDETNDIETDDEQENVSGEYFEVAAWNLDSSGSKSEATGNSSSKMDESLINVDEDKQIATENVVDLLSDEDNCEKSFVNDHSMNSVGQSPHTVVANEKTRSAGTSGINSNSEKSETDHSKKDVVISPTDVPNIFDIDGTTSCVDFQADREIAEEIETTDRIEQDDSNATTEEVEAVPITDKTEDEVENAKEAQVEEEKITIPYEETVMFKLLTDELDNFMKDDTAVAKYNVVKETVSSKAENEAVVSIENKDSKQGPMKKFKKYADAEIMQNIEETYLFTGSRATRNTAGKEAMSNNETNNSEKAVNANESENKDGDEQKASSDENDQVHDSEVSTNEHGSADLEKEKLERDFSDNEKHVSTDLIHTDIPVDITGADNQKKGERSLFDILVNESETSDNSKEDNIGVAVTSNISDEKKDEFKSPFSLFGNLMKNFKVPESFGVKSPTVTENVAEMTEPTPDAGKSIGSPGKAELNKDRMERNLFDFICPEPESPKTPTVASPQQAQSPRMHTRSLFKAGGSPTSPAQTPSPVKVTPVKKPMFKFPKLALPVNFGNIAKLGMAKLKEGEKTKEEKDSKIVESETEGSVKDDIPSDEVNSRDERKKIMDEEDNKVETDTTKETKNDIVMETFEELRQRLARERAANKLEKEKLKAITVDTESVDVDEIDGSREISANITPSESTEIDSEMYKDFTPQKIVLILDISKKHGIEFASTSFGLPVSVIVNWIFEKDRKQRKAALSVSLEEKFKALKNMKDGVITREDAKEQHCVDDLELIKWESEFGWMIENKSVCDVLEKWQKVETVTNINFEECVKNLERKDSLVEKEQNEDQEKTTEVSEKTDAEITEKDEKAEVISESNEDDVIITKVEKHSGEEVTEVPSVENTLDESVTDSERKDVPEIISFVKTTKPRDFTLEQKAMFALLVEKYGNQVISKKFGINTGTLYNWRHTNKPIRQYLYEQGHSSKMHTDESNTGDKKTENTLPQQQSQTFNPADYMPVRETRSSSDKKNTTSSNETVKSNEMPKSSKETTASKPVLPLKAKRKEMDSRLETDLIDHPKGYRIISPTKLPPVLRDLRRGQTKDYTLEQRVAIVKLVQLYGVRTIHKQFRIPAGSIWNWQHAKSVIDVLKEEEKLEKESQSAQRELDFDEEDKEDEDEPVTIDTVLDRVLIASDTVNHLNFDLDQKADVVCLINHFGIDYFCEKVPQIPRGTLWNWRHNRHVATLVEKRNEMIKKFSDILNERKGKGMRENVVGETVDKTDLTQKWLKNLQDSVRDKRREGSVESVKRKRDIEDELETLARSSAKKKPKLGPMCYKRSLSNDRNRRSLSPSTISSEISVHSDDFEEILSDDELNTPSVISKRSGASTQTVQSNKTNKSQQRTSKGSASVKFESGLVLQSNIQDIDKTDETAVPVHEIIKFESDQDDRMMVCYKDLEETEVASKYVKLDNQNLAVKRPSPNELSASQPVTKKRNPKVAEVNDPAGNWVPLDEYYYGTHDGDAAYTEEKGEYRFKCWYCSKMLYNNVRAMQHIQGHIDASKQQNIDLSDLTQCKHCYKQFDTPFEMQTHVEKVHLSNKVLMCRICEKDFSTPRELTVHMKGCHHACEMPYVCHLCNFRSSMYSDVVDHFKKKHDSSHYMLCLYCLRTFEVKFVSQGWGQTQTYYGHLLKHQTKSATKKCVVCRLTFFNTLDVKNHRKNCHIGHFKDVKALSSGGKADSGQRQKKGSNLKSLNAPSVSRIQDYGEIIFPAEASNTKCVECKMMMSSTDHYKKYVHCSMCRFATSCSVAYANHMMGFHSGQMSSLNLNIPWERPMREVMYCACGFNSKYGNKIANHLVYCAKWTCYSTKRTQSDATPGRTGDEEKEGSILGMLGLVQKSTVATKIRSKPKLGTKSGIKIEGIEVKANKKYPGELKSEHKPVAEERSEKSDEKEPKEIIDIENEPVRETTRPKKQNERPKEIIDIENEPVRETTRPKKQDERPTDISYKSNVLVKSDKAAEDGEKEKLEQKTDITETDKREAISENLENKDEKELVSPEVVSEPAKPSEDAQPETDTKTEQDKSSSAAENEQEVTKDTEEIMDTETVDEPDETTEDSQTEMDAETTKSEDNIEPAEIDDNTSVKDEAVDIDTKETHTQENLKPENSKDDSEDVSDSEPLNETVEDKEIVHEMDTLDEAVESPKANLEKDENSLKEASDVKQFEFGETGLDSESEETAETIESIENEKELLEPTTENTEESEEPPMEMDEKSDDQTSQENETTEQSKEKQDLSDSSENKKDEPKEDEKPEEDTEPKEEKKPKETERSSQKESSDHGDSRRSAERTSSSDHRDSTDRRSQERRTSSDHRDSSDRRSQEKHTSSDHRDSSERHSRDRNDSGDRHHSGSSDRSRHDDRSRQDDRHRQDNRSYGSNRSDNYHGSRSSYDQNRDRDRSYDRDRDRDRDRDYNRNRDYRHGDSRSGHGYQDNRGQSYGSGGQGYRGSQGQYGSYQGNRGDHYQDRNRGGHQQDRNYNRNYQNRGGYNQNYRGGYRGGYY